MWGGRVRSETDRGRSCGATGGRTQPLNVSGGAWARVQRQVSPGETRRRQAQYSESRWAYVDRWTSAYRSSNSRRRFALASTRSPYSGSSNRLILWAFVRTRVRASSYVVSTGDTYIRHVDCTSVVYNIIVMWLKHASHWHHNGFTPWVACLWGKNLWVCVGMRGDAGEVK